MSAPWLKWYPSDWRSDPALRMCSIGARGLWKEMLCLMHEADPVGSLLINGVQPDDRQLAMLVGVPLAKLAPLRAELERHGVFSRDPDGTIYSRRMRRDTARAARDKANGRVGGNPQIRRGVVPKEERVRPFKRTDAPEKTRRIFERDHGRCHWCGVELLFEGEGGKSNLFHVDHVVAVCDGGTNDESNLVAACAACNHKRKLAGWEPPPDSNGGVRVGRAPDNKAQKPEARLQNGGASAPPGERAGDAPPDASWLRQQVFEAMLGTTGTPHDTSRCVVWLRQGYDPEICAAVVTGCLARKPDIGGLAYFDKPIADAHAACAPKERPRHAAASTRRSAVDVALDLAERYEAEERGDVPRLRVVGGG